jgi:uncharacterized protein
MKILVTADAHIPDWYDALPDRLIQDARNSDVILLAGDIVGKEVIDTLKECARVEAVYGNFCHWDLKRTLPAKKVLEIGKWKVGLTHGHLGTGKTVDEMSASLFDEPLDLLIHGHTHQHHQSKIGNVLIVEPGSPVDTRFTTTRSYAMLSLDEEIEIKFVILK